MTIEDLFRNTRNVHTLIASENTHGLNSSTLRDKLTQFTQIFKFSEEALLMFSFVQDVL